MNDIALRPRVFNTTCLGSLVHFPLPLDFVDVRGNSLSELPFGTSFAFALGFCRCGRKFGVEILSAGAFPLPFLGRDCSHLTRQREEKPSVCLPRTSWARAVSESSSTWRFLAAVAFLLAPVISTFFFLVPGGCLLFLAFLPPVHESWMSIRRGQDCRRPRTPSPGHTSAPCHNCYSIPKFRSSSQLCHGRSQHMYLFS